MPITYRPATRVDLAPASLVVRQAIDDLRRRHGFGALITPPATSPQPSLSFPEFCLSEDSSGLWVAEDDSTIVGFGFSWMIGTLWCLSQLFVKPGQQAEGVGRVLLGKTLDQAHKGPARNKVVITFAYNTASVGLYLRHGLYPREPLYRLVAPVSTVMQKTFKSTYDCVPIDPVAKSAEWIGPIDDEILGFRRESHHGFLSGTSAAEGFRIEHAGRPVGYAYIAGNGHIGPVAVTSEASGAEVIKAVLRRAPEGRPQRLSMFVPGSADSVMGALGELGFRIEEPYVLMSVEPFGNWRHYLPRAPGYL